MAASGNPAATFADRDTWHGRDRLSYAATGILCHTLAVTDANPQTATPETRTSWCPQCGAALPSTPGFVVWCPSCNWNVAPDVEKPAEVTRWHQLQRRLADGDGRRLLARTAVSGTVEDTTSLAAALLLRLLVLPVHLVTVACLLGGGWLVFEGSTWVVKAGGIMLLLAALATRPSLPKRPAHLARLTAETSPGLYGLVAEIGRVTKAPMPDEILVTSSFKADSVRVGLRRRVLVIGTPIWVATSPPARVALIAHELGHFAHGDLNSGLWVSTGVDTLQKWELTLTPAPNRTVPGLTPLRNGGVSGLVSLMQAVPMAIMRAPVRVYATVLLRLNAPARRRQELLSDLAAVRAGGTEGATALFDAMLAQGGIETAMTRAAVSPSKPDLWSTVLAEVASTPPTEIERRRRAAALTGLRVDNMHPATATRLRLVLQAPTVEGAVRPTRETWAAVDRDLQPLLASAAKAIGDRVRYQR